MYHSLFLSEMLFRTDRPVGLIFNHRVLPLRKHYWKTSGEILYVHQMQQQRECSLSGQKRLRVRLISWKPLCYGKILEDDENNRGINGL